MMLSTTLLLTLAAISPSLAHNILYCSNSKPNMTALLGLWDPLVPETDTSVCHGFPRAMPSNESAEWKLYSDQGWPWQGIYSVQDGAALANHRAVNWLQEDPVYDPSHPPTTVKPGSTVLLQVQTNNHAHEIYKRPTGSYKIFLAGASGTQIKTVDQLTFDRVVFSAPENKYAHVWTIPPAELESPKPDGPFFYDRGFSYLPLKLVDPSGAYLPEGTYNFVWTWWWASPQDDGSLIDYLIPAYSSSFDIVISSASDDSGFLTDCVEKNKNCANDLVGYTNVPGAKDTTNPWPPYPDGYLTSNLDGDDPSTASGQRQYKPFYTESVPADNAPAISTKVTPAVRSLGNDDTLRAPLPQAAGVVSPPDLKSYTTAVGMMVALPANGDPPKQRDPYDLDDPAMSKFTGTTLGGTTTSGSMYNGTTTTTASNITTGAGTGTGGISRLSTSALPGAGAADDECEL